MHFVRKLLLIVLLCGIGVFALLALGLKTAPAHYGDETHFDTLIVLGSPANPDGTPGREMGGRVDEAVREYRAGVASHIIMSGAAAHNRFVEAQVMADDAVRQAVPRDVIVVEGQAKDTIQNIWYSRQIMQANGWHSAEIISAPSHLPRTARILGYYRGAQALEWRTHADIAPEYSTFVRFLKESHEMLGLLKLWLDVSRHSRFIPNS